MSDFGWYCSVILGCIVMMGAVAIFAPRESPRTLGYCETATLAPIDSSCQRSLR